MAGVVPITQSAIMTLPADNTQRDAQLQEAMASLMGVRAQIVDLDTQLKTLRIQEQKLRILIAQLT